MPHAKAKAEGLTLIELMVVIAIVGILIALAAPSFRNLIIKNKVQAAASEFQSALALARSEAVKRGGDARITVVANSLSGTSPVWTSGLTVFYDTTTNANGNAPPSDASKLIMKTAAMDAGVQAVVGFSAITFNGFGRSISSTGAPLGGTAAFGATDSDWICNVIGLSGRINSKTVSNAAYKVEGCN